MLFGKAVRLCSAALLMAGTMLGGQAMAASADTEPKVAAAVVTYDASGAAEFRGAVDSGAAIWNQSVSSVQLRPVQAGESPNIRILADNGWPRAYVTSLGNGTVYMGRQAVNEGHHTVRIASHELGHILGLPDMKPGPCSSLMSGSSAGTSCTNAYPNAAEKAEVQSNFGGFATPLYVRPLVFQD